MSKILIHSIVFSPDGVSTAYLYNDIALKFKEAGHKVIVLTTTPNYNIVESEVKKQPLTKKFFGLYYLSDFNGIPVKHISQKKYKNPTLRILGFIYWHIISFFLGLFEKDLDIIISPSPPLSIGLINIFLGKIKKTKVIYNVQEIYPDLLIQSGLKSKIFISILKWMEKTVYNHSDVVTTIDQVFYNTIVDRFKDKSKLHVIPNFVDTDLYKPLDLSKLTLDHTLFPPHTNKLKLMYAGNIGYAQDWKTLIHVAEKLLNEPIVFYVIGEGVLKDFLIRKIKEKNLSNIHVVPYQPRELIPQILAYSDLQFIFMTPQTEGHGFPSKVYTIMSCAKPLLVCSGKGTPIVNFLKDKNCAYLVTEKDENIKVESVIKILQSIKESQLMQKGKNGYSYILDNYSKRVVTEEYLSLINNLIV